MEDVGIAEGLVFWIIGIYNPYNAESNGKEHGTNGNWDYREFRKG